jgi:transcriptional regulator with XRE-family HTH domain
MDLDDKLLARILGNLIREKRLELGLSQIEFGEEIDIHHNNVSKLELGDSSPKASTTYYLRHNLGINLNELYDEAKKQMDDLMEQKKRNK